MQKNLTELVFILDRSGSRNMYYSSANLFESRQKFGRLEKRGGSYK